jgi:hypothetical protein
MAKMNMINNAAEDLTIRPQSAGDQWIQFDIAGS